MQCQFRQVLASLPILCLLKVWNRMHLENSSLEKQFELEQSEPCPSSSHPPNPICIKASGNKRRQPCLDNRKQQAERQRKDLLWSSILEIGGEKEARRSLKQSRSAFRWACIQPGCAAVSPANTSQVPDPCYLHLLPTSCIFCMHPLVTPITCQNADLPYLTGIMSNDIRSPYAPSEHKQEITEAEKVFWGPKNPLLTVLGTWKGKKVLYLA